MYDTRVRTRLALALCVVLALLGFAVDAGAVIRLGRGIGRVNLGMTSAQLVRAVGKPVAIRQGGGAPVAGRLSKDPTYVEYEYVQTHGYTVGLAKRGGKLRVVMVVIYIRGQRTPQGVGVGSSAGQMRLRYPGARCSLLDEAGQACLVPRKSNGETVFVVDTTKSSVRAVAIRARK